MTSEIKGDPATRNEVDAADRMLESIERILEATRALRTSVAETQEREAARIAAEERLRRTCNEMVRRVEERTRDLSQANAELRRRKAQLDHALREKEQLLKEVHHRIKYNRQIVSSLLSIQVRMSDPGSRELLRGAQSRVLSIALAHEAIYRSIDRKNFDIDTYFRRLVGSIAAMYQRDGVSVEIHVENVPLGVDVAVHSSLLINELVTNAFKHAFVDGRKGAIRVALEREQGGGARLTVADDGVGLPEGLDLHDGRSLGLSLVVNLTEQIGGTLEVERAGGTRFTIQFLPDCKPGSL